MVAARKLKSMAAMAIGFPSSVPKPVWTASFSRFFLIAFQSISVGSHSLKTQDVDREHIGIEFGKSVGVDQVIYLSLAERLK